jgi:hypothetical protein
MKRKKLVERIAEQREVPLHTAADWLDSFLHDLMHSLKGLASPAKAHESNHAAPRPPVEATKVRPADLP